MFDQITFRDFLTRDRLLQLLAIVVAVAVFAASIYFGDVFERLFDTNPLLSLLAILLLVVALSGGATCGLILMIGLGQLAQDRGRRDRDHETLPYRWISAGMPE